MSGASHQTLNLQPVLEPGPVLACAEMRCIHLSQSERETSRRLIDQIRNDELLCWRH